MKKRFLTLPFCLLSALASFPAQGQVIEESFETWPPEGWAFHSEFGEGSWEQSALDEPNAPGSAADGTHAAMIDYANTYFVQLCMTTPVFDISDLQNPQLSFQWYHQGSEDDRSTLEIHLAYEEGVFERVETIETDLATEGWQTYTRSLNRGVEQVRIIGIKDWYACDDPLYIDLFRIAEGPSCVPPVETGYRLLPGTDGSVLLSGTPANEEDRWEVKVSSTPIDPATQTADILEQEVPGEPQCQVEGLHIGSHCYWYVRTLCDEPSAWFQGKTFLVDPAPLQVPFLVDFEQGESGFVALQENQLNTWQHGHVPYVADTNQCFYISNDGGASYAYTNLQESRSYLYREIAFPDSSANGFELSFDFTGMGSAPNHVMEIYLVENLDYYPEAGIFTDPVFCDEIGDNFCNSPEWQNFKLELPANIESPTQTFVTKIIKH